MHSPEHLDKYQYIVRTPTWKVRTMYALGILAWLPIVWTTIMDAGSDLFFTLFVTPIILIFTVHYLASFTLTLFYKQFDLPRHLRLVETFWKENTEPSVDVYLPICGEDLEVLRNTWEHVTRLNYVNKKVYVLDDSKDECAEHRALAEHFGFTYFERPNKGEMKKAGNLKYAYARTEGEIIAILDADFAVHPDYLIELVPYMSEERVGIVQSPQYFPVTAETHQNGPLAYGGARAQEVFYRMIQVARDRLGGAHCCGTCALYRRAALASIGGFVQMGHSEDAHTGFTLTAHNWTVRYVPVLLSIGVSPENPHAFFHQQHRWCLGNILMMLDKKFWQAPIPLRIKYCYITGFLFYLHQPFVLLISFQLFWVLLFHGDGISLTAGLPFYPHILWALSYMLFIYIAPLRWGYLYAILMRAYAYCHAIVTIVLGQSVGWIPTNSKQAGLSAAFRQTVLGVSLYVLAYMVLIAVAIRAEAFQLFEVGHASVQFWIFYNLILSGVLLFHLYKTMEQAQMNQEKTTHHPSKKWQLKTVGAYGSLTALLFFGVVYFPDSITIANTPLDPTVAVMSVSVADEAAGEESIVFSADLQLFNSGPAVKHLQQFLNAQGFRLAETGPGSLGSETEVFGSRTYRALIKYQKAHNIDPTGFFGQTTRNSVNFALEEKEGLVYLPQE